MPSPLAGRPWPAVRHPLLHLAVVLALAAAVVGLLALAGWYRVAGVAPAAAGSAPPESP